MKIFTLVKVAGLSSLRSSFRKMEHSLKNTISKLPLNPKNKSIIKKNNAEIIGKATIKRLRPTLRAFKTNPSISKITSIKNISNRMDKMVENKAIKPNRKINRELGKKFAPLVSKKLRLKIERL